MSSPADIAIYGGAAGGGKTWALLMEPLRHVANPGFGAVIFRRTSPQITNEGGLWDESMTLYPLAGAIPSVGSLDWRFPSGSNVGFRHLQHEVDKLTWQGAQVCLLAFDELTHFTESQFFYLLSRNRSTCGVRPYVRATTNPDATSWVKRFLAPWVDREFDGPGPKARSGEVRWFVRDGGEILWVPTGTPDAKSVTFVRASLFDNRVLMAKDPGYLANLKALPPVERARLLDGDWDVKREGLVYPGFDACLVRPDEVPDPLEGYRVGGIDFGFNHPFAAVSGVVDDRDVLWVLRERYARAATTPDHAAALPRDVEKWWADPSRPESIAELRRADHGVHPCVHKGPRPLLTGIDRVSDRLRSGRLKVSRECRELVREMGLYQYDPEKVAEEPLDRDNHAPDALRYLVVGLDRGRAARYAPPDTTAEDEAREKARREADHEAFRDIENDHWWEA